MNLFKAGPEGPEEVIDILFEAPGVRLEKITSFGHSSPEGFWYEQEENEWVSLIEGWARIDFADGRHVILKAGDHLLIPAYEGHRVAETSKPAIWLCLFA